MLQLRRSNEQQYSNSPEIFREVFFLRTLVPLIVSGDSQDRLWAVELTRVRSCLDRQRLTRKPSCSAQARVKQARQKARIVKQSRRWLQYSSPPTSPIPIPICTSTLTAR